MPSSQDQMRIDRLHKQKLDFKKLYLTFLSTFSKTFSWSLFFFLYENQVFFRNFSSNPFATLRTPEISSSKFKTNSLINFFQEIKKSEGEIARAPSSNNEDFHLNSEEQLKNDTTDGWCFVLLFQFILFSNISCIETKLT